MKFVKGLAVSLFNFLLFVALSVFGLAYTLNQTVLDREFLASELNRLDVSGLLNEVIGRPVSQQLTQQIGQQIPGGAGSGVRRDRRQREGTGPVA